MLSRAVILAALSLLLTGCATTPTPPSPAAERVGPLASGWEVRVWIADNTPRVQQLPLSPNALRRYQALDQPTFTVEPPTWIDAVQAYESRPVPIPQPTLDLWRANGLRVYSVPVADLPALQKQIRLVGPSQERWLGQTPVWAEVLRGPPLARPDALLMDSGPLRVEGGAARLLLRGWLIPSSHLSDSASSTTPPEFVGPPAPAHDNPGRPTRAALQLEILPQHHLPKPPPDTFTLEPTRAPRPEEEGLLFERLALRAALDGHHTDAIVVVPDAAYSTDTADTPSLGPAPPPGLTFGQALLTDKPQRRAVNTVAVLILIPRATDTFTLLGE